VNSFICPLAQETAVADFARLQQSRAFWIFIHVEMPDSFATSRDF
jgi:hypothetical protein